MKQSKPTSIIFGFLFFTLTLSCDLKTDHSTAEIVTLQAAKEDQLSDNKIPAPTEAFVLDNDTLHITFIHKNYQNYVLWWNGQETHGEMNTEKGIGTDRNATVYVLNWDQPPAEQKFFVRYSDGTIVLLDHNRNKMPGLFFTKK